MRYSVLLLIILLFTSCGVEPVKTQAPPVKWGPEIDYHYDTSMYEHPNIITNFETIFDEISTKVKLDFFESAEPGRYIILIVYGYGENIASIGKCEIPYIKITSGRLDVAHHEVRHALGDRHMHQVDFRDKYIQVNFNKVPEKAMSDFIIISADKFLYNIYKYKYDYKSIMHYSSKTWGADIRHINGSRLLTNRYPSKMDWEKLIEIYGKR